MTGELLSKAQRNMCHSRSINTTTVWRNMNYLLQNGKSGNTENTKNVVSLQGKGMQH